MHPLPRWHKRSEFTNKYAAKLKELLEEDLGEPAPEAPPALHAHHYHHHARKAHEAPHQRACARDPLVKRRPRGLYLPGVLPPEAQAEHPHGGVPAPAGAPGSEANPVDRSTPATRSAGGGRGEDDDRLPGEECRHNGLAGFNTRQAHRARDAILAHGDDGCGMNEVSTLGLLPGEGCGRDGGAALNTRQKHARMAAPAHGDDGCGMDEVLDPPPGHDGVAAGLNTRQAPGDGCGKNEVFGPLPGHAGVATVLNTRQAPGDACGKNEVFGPLPGQAGVATGLNTRQAPGDGCGKNEVFGPLPGQAGVATGLNTARAPGDACGKNEKALDPLPKGRDGMTELHPERAPARTATLARPGGACGKSEALGSLRGGWGNGKAGISSAAGLTEGIAWGGGGEEGGCELYTRPGGMLQRAWEREDVAGVSFAVGRLGTAEVREAGLAKAARAAAQKEGLEQAAQGRRLAHRRMLDNAWAVAAMWETKRQADGLVRQRNRAWVAFSCAARDGHDAAPEAAAAAPKHAGCRPHSAPVPSFMRLSDSCVNQTKVLESEELYERAALEACLVLKVQEEPIAAKKRADGVSRKLAHSAAFLHRDELRARTGVEQAEVLERVTATFIGRDSALSQNPTFAF
ncbi:hypothetical protein DIPPA_20178 [Diplonema papillatum]|nr:hypothetical protein DIPPA_20178 [Diplonema papillatum]